MISAALIWELNDIDLKINGTGNEISTGTNNMVETNFHCRRMKILI